MTIDTTVSEVSYVGDGLVSAWPFTFPIHKKADVVVTVTTIATGDEVVINSADYNFTLTDADEYTGYVTYPLSGALLASTHRITLTRTVAYTQDLIISNQSRFLPRQIEKQLDRIVMQNTQLARELAEAVADIDDLGGDVDSIYDSVLANLNYVNPCEDRFGGVGDATLVGNMWIGTDDTAACQAALNYIAASGGGTLRLTNRHKVTGKLTYSSDSAPLAIIADTHEMGGFYYAASADEPVIEITLTSYTTSPKVYIERLSVVRSSPDLTPGGTGIVITYNTISSGAIKGCEIKSCFIYASNGGYFTNGITLTRTPQTVIRDCFIKGKAGLTVPKFGHGIKFNTWGQGSGLYANKIYGFKHGILADESELPLGETYEAEGYKIETNQILVCEYCIYVNIPSVENSWSFVGNVLNSAYRGMYLRNLVNSQIIGNRFQWNIRSVAHADIELIRDDGEASPTLTVQNQYAQIIGNKTFSDGNMKVTVTGVSLATECVVTYTTASSTNPITGISATSPAIVTYSGGTDYIVEGDVVYISGITTGPTELNGMTFTAGTVDASGAGGDIELEGVDGSLLSAAWSAGGTIGLAENTGTIANGDEIFIYGVNGATEVNNKPYIVSDLNTGAGTFKIKNYETGAYVDSTAWTAYTNSGLATRFGRFLEVKSGKNIIAVGNQVIARNLGLYVWPSTANLYWTNNQVANLGTPRSAFEAVNNSTLPQTVWITKVDQRDSYNLGTISSGTVTPIPAQGSAQRLVNGGAFTLAVPTPGGFGDVQELIVDITNNATAGAVTTSGFTKVTGSFTTTNGDKFRCRVSVVNGNSLLEITALQ